MTTTSSSPSLASATDLATSMVNETSSIRWRVDHFDWLNDEASNDDSKSINSPTFSAAGHQWYLKLRSCFTQDRGVHRDKICTGIFLRLAPTETAEVTASVRFVMRGANTTSASIDTGTDSWDIRTKHAYSVNGTDPRGMTVGRTEVETVATKHGNSLIFEAHITVVKPNHDISSAGLSASTLADDFAKLLTNNTGDVVFKVHGESLKAHRAILSVRSDVFKKMFGSGMSESKDGEVIIDDITVPVFKQLLRFVYTGACDQLDDAAPALDITVVSLKRKDSVSSPRSSSASSSSASPATMVTRVKRQRSGSSVTGLDDDTPEGKEEEWKDGGAATTSSSSSSAINNQVSALDLMVAAHRYELKGLIELCGVVLVKSLSADNVINRLIIADRYDSLQLKQAAISFVAKNRIAVKGQAALKDLSSSLLIELITTNGFS